MKGFTGCAAAFALTAFASWAATGPDVDALLARMTLEEKIGQVCQENSKSGHVPATSQDATGETMSECFLARIRRGEIGSIISAPGVANYNAMQRAARESRLGIPLLVGHDLIHTARIGHPIPLAQSCSWDPELCRRVADSIARNGRLLGVNWTFAPMLDIARDARWGRIAESPGQDPYLASLIAAAQVRGFQGDDPSDGTHLAACAKHFLGYGAVESGRDYNTVEMWDGTMRDIYLPPFAAAVKVGCLTVMPGYHSYNGRPCSMNRYLLTDVLRGELGFDGYVISDYGSVNMIVRHGTGAAGADIAAKALHAGVDQEMTGDHFRSGLKEALEKGLVGMGDLDAAVRRILSVKNRMGLFADPFIDEAKCERNVDRQADLSLALEAAEKSAVLLKNDGILPLDRTKRVAIMGSLADAGLYGCWSGMTTIRGDHLIQYLPQLGYRTKYTKGFTVDTGSMSNWHPVTTVDPEAISAAAKEADVIVAVFGGVDNMSGENMSFADVSLPGRQKDAARAIIATGKPFVAVLANGRPMAIPELKEHANAIFEAWHGGTLASKAIARLLAGEVEPYGRLTVDFPYATGECPVYYNALRTGNPYIIGGTREQNQYRGQYRDTPNEPLYVFGHGLTYTTFAYSNETAVVRGGEIVCALDVVNTGTRRGSEVVQAYVRIERAETCRPRRELKGFRRVFLEPGERKSVEIRIPLASLAYHDESRLVRARGDVTVFLAPDSGAGKPLRISVD